MVGFLIIIKIVTESRTFKVLKMMKRVRVAISLIGLYKDDDLQEANYHMVQLALKYPNK
jgi:hypothetical protein